MTFPASTYVLEVPGEIHEAGYQQGLDGFVAGVVRYVEREMQGQPAHMVYEVLSLRISRRLPGIAVDHEVLRDASARIAIGLPGI